MIPEKIKIGGIEYTVKMVDEVDENDNNIDGKICFHHQEIRIKKGMGKDYTVKVLIHEIIHGILNHCVINKWEGDEEECFVEKFAHALHQVLKDNRFDFFVKGGE